MPRAPSCLTARSASDNAADTLFIGTLDETIEILSWRQLGLHDKPVVVVDIAGYWSPLAELFEHIAASRFAAPLVPALVSFVPDVAALFAALGR